MPWKETCAMDERIQFDQCICARTLFAACGLRTQQAHSLQGLERYALYGPAGFLERSRAPKQHPNQTPAAIEARIIALRQRHPQWGPRKLLARLEREDPQQQWPAQSTAGEILKRHGLTQARRVRRRTPGYEGPRHQGISPNDVWTADFKSWFQTCYAAGSTR